MSMDRITEEDSDSFDSNTDAIIYGASDDSGSGESMISDPNIPSSSSDDDEDFRQQQIFTAAGGSGGTDDLTVPSCASSSWFTNNNKQIMIFNVDFRALSSEGSVCNNSDNEAGKVNINFCGKRVREGENEDEVNLMIKKEKRREQMPDPLIIPSSWSSFWDLDEDGKGIFNVPPLSPLSPYASFGYPQLMVI
ncbi:hypothetical protein HAX54_007856 [Datura stramonium]|uniref:Uncharacterized protein n=1 Tax=Datura stramonium TaxID=4076 RepID=A0ABS8RV28_DATST|nr:hypothetical protein [Datura stramonium]